MPLGLSAQYKALQRLERVNMDNTVIAMINGEERELNYSIEIMFRVNEKFGGVNQALKAIEGDTRDSVQAVRWFAVQLANDGELCRREAGNDPRKMLTIDDISMRMSPLDYMLLKNAVVNAIVAGYRREVNSTEEVDLGLAEINEKKAPAGA